MLIKQNQRFNTKKFNQPYTVTSGGRNSQTQFAASRSWCAPLALNMWNTIQKHQPKLVVLWGDPNTNKTHFSLVFGEAMPWSDNRIMMVHTNNLVDQHSDLAEHYLKQGFLTKPVKVFTIHKMYAVIMKAKKTSIMSDEDLQILNYLLNTTFITADECHKYAKGKEAKMFVEIMKYLMTHGQLKTVLGTTATAKKLHRMWDWADTFINRKQYTFRPDKKLLLMEGWRPVPTEYLQVDSKTTVFDKNSVEAKNIAVRANDPSFKAECVELFNKDFENSVDNLIAEDHKLKMREDATINLDEYLKYQDNRANVAVDHFLRKIGKGPVMINVTGIINAEKYANDANKMFAAKKLPIEAIHWNSLSKNNHTFYKQNERAMLKDLFDPKKPLKVVFTNGMLVEGTNRPFQAVYQCAFTPTGTERSIQLGNRSPHLTVILLDAQIFARLPKKNTAKLEELLKNANINATPEQLRAAAAAYQMEGERQGHGVDVNEIPTPQIDLDAWANNLNNQEDYVTDQNTEWAEIISKDVWVYDVEYQGNYNTLPLNTHLEEHRTVMDALDTLYHNKTWKNND